MSDTNVPMRMHVAVASGSRLSYFANSTLHLRNLDCYAVIRDFRSQILFAATSQLGANQARNKILSETEIR